MVGIDGCKAGWCIAYGRNLPRLTVISKLSELSKYISKPSRILIDIPLGLPSLPHQRSAEDKARKLLGRKASSVFNVPCRDAVYASSYNEANQINLNIMGKGLSIQTWNIVSKIKEADELLRHGESKIDLKEAHPELCFKFLSEYPNDLTSKKSAEGQRQRLDILALWNETLSDFYHDFISNTFRKDVGKDDILDALVLWLSAILSDQYPLSAIAANKEDDYGIVMNMHIVNPYGHDI